MFLWLTNGNRVAVLTNHSRLGHPRGGLLLKDAEIGFAEMNNVGIIKGTSIIPACNPNLVVPQMQLLPPNKHDMGSLNNFS